MKYFSLSNSAFLLAAIGCISLMACSSSDDTKPPTGSGGAGAGGGTGASGGNGGQPTGPGGGGAGGGYPPLEAEAFALPAAQWNPSGSGGAGGGMSGTTGTGIDPNTLYIVLSNGGPSCSDADHIPCNGEWKVGIGLSPEQQQPGTLELNPLINWVMVSFADEPMCPSYLGYLTEGTLELLAVNEREVRGVLHGSQVPGQDLNEKEFRAPLCP